MFFVKMKFKMGKYANKNSKNIIVILLTGELIVFTEKGTANCQ